MKIKWCGCIIDSKGYQFDTRNIEAIQTTNFQVPADDLCQFIHLCGWMTSSLPNFHGKVQPLTDIQKAAYKIAGNQESTL